MRATLLFTSDKPPVNFSAVAALHTHLAASLHLNQGKHGFFDPKAIGFVHPAIANNLKILALAPNGM